MNEQIKKALSDYAWIVLGSAAGMYASGITDPQTLAYSLLGAILPIVKRAVDPSDTAFGRMPSVEDVDAALKSAKIVKKPVKKAPAKKKKSGGGGTPQQAL